MAIRKIILLGMLIALTLTVGSIQARDDDMTSSGLVQPASWPAESESVEMVPAAGDSVSTVTATTISGTTEDLDPSTARLCNGLPYQCDRPFDEVTFPGNHNAGSNRVLKWDCGGPDYPDCVVRNQGRSITEQLQFGIRYFDIDTCVCSVSGLVTCHSSWIGDPISQLLDEFDAFLNQPENRNEVIVLTFGDQNVSPEYIPLLQGLLYDELRSRWEPTPVRIANKDLTIYKPLTGEPPGTWPTLGKLVASNRRIVVFARDPIDSLQEIGVKSERDAIFDTFISRECTSDCDGVVSDTFAKCQVAASYSYNLDKLVLVSVTCSQGLCIDWLAKLCQPYLLSSLNTCRDALGGVRVPNFITADYTEKLRVAGAPHLPEKQNVVEAVRFFNLNHLKESVTLPISNGTASYIGFESNRNGKMISSGIAFHTQWISDQELWKWVPLEEPSDRLQYGQRIFLQSKTTDQYLSNMNNALSEMPNCLANEYWTIEKYSPTNNKPVGTVGEVQAGDEICLRSELDGGEYVRASPDNNYLWITDHCESDEKWLLYAHWNDSDKDFVIDEGDNCPDTPNPDQSDRDMDGEGDVCDATPGGLFLPAILRP